MQKCVALFLWPNVQVNTTIMNCSAPWRGLHIRTNGDILTCCAGQKSLGNIHKDKLEDVLNGPMIKEVRKSIKNGKLHKDYCSRCIEIKKNYPEVYSQNSMEEQDFQRYRDYVAPDEHNSDAPVNYVQEAPNEEYDVAAVNYAESSRESDFRCKHCEKIWINVEYF